MSLNRVKKGISLFLLSSLMVTVAAISSSLSKTQVAIAGESPSIQVPVEPIYTPNIIRPDRKFVNQSEIRLAQLEWPFGRQCATGYLCVFENEDFGGRRLQFNIPGDIDLKDYGFEGQMSSWINNTDEDAVWGYERDGMTRIGCMKAQTRADYIGDIDNDKVTHIILGQAC